MLLDHIRKLQIANYTVLNPMSLTWSPNEVVIVSHAASANAFLIVGFFIQISVVFFTPKYQLAIQLCTLITHACKLWLDWYWGQDSFQCSELCITVYLLYWPLWHKNRAPRVSAFMSMRILEGLCVVKKTQYLIPIYNNTLGHGRVLYLQELKISIFVGTSFFGEYD